MLWRGGLSMSDFAEFSDDIDAGMAWLEHHGILGQKHGVQNGPPYPLGSGDHSSAEKQAASAAGVKVGKDSGKGSIDNVKKKKKKPLTPEEKREQALAAAKSGDKKKIAKNIDDLSTDELRDAAERARLKEQLTRKDPSEVKMSKADMEKMNAIRSGDKELVKQYADKMSFQELQEAMNRVDLNAKLNYVAPQPSAMDKLKKFSQSVEDFRQVAERGVNAYNLAAKVYNSTHKDGTKWPIIGGDQKKEKSAEEKAAEIIAKSIGKDVAKTAKDNAAKKEEDYQKKSDEQRKNALIDYKNEKRLEQEKAIFDAKEKAKADKKAAKEEAKRQAAEEAAKKKNPQPDDSDDDNRLYTSTVNQFKLSHLSDFEDYDYNSIFDDDNIREVMNRKVS